jgi:cytosine/adenosine deaminase-related metal-dependent hydrolase
MLDMGIPVALCSDAYAIDPLNRMIQGYHLHRHFERFTKGSRSLDPLELLQMATRGAAKVFGVEKDSGSIEEGKRAYIVLLDLDKEVFDPFWNPDFWKLPPQGDRGEDWLEPMRKLIQCGAVSCRDVCAVFVGGKKVYPSNDGYHAPVPPWKSECSG